MVTKPPPITPDELDRLIADLEEGAFSQQAVPPSDVEAPPVRKFSELEPFDVKGWAERKGIKLPDH